MIDYLTTSKMRVDKSDLDGAVVEDGETTPVRRADEFALTTKNRGRLDSSCFLEEAMFV